MSYNVWDLKGVAKDRGNRMQDLPHRLADTDFDVYLLQELWEKDDFDRVRGLLQEKGLTATSFEDVVHSWDLWKCRGWLFKPAHCSG